jgi:heterodisulfide reductase subunit A
MENEISENKSNEISKQKAVLVIGGGIAGIEAALNLAEFGVKVYLVEISPSIGGLMARLNKTFPTNDCSICIEAPKMYDIIRNDNIELLTYTDIRRARFENGRFKVRLNKKSRFVDEEKCKGCGKCIEVCPVTVKDELDGKLGGTRKLISIPFPQAVPNAFIIDPDCRQGKLYKKEGGGACIGGCDVDCIQCRECQIAKCVVACRDEGAEAVLLWGQNQLLDIEVDSIIVASGLEPFEIPAGYFGYDVFDNVITHLQYERLTNAGGPTLGEIVRPSDEKHPKRIMWIQCVGRDTKLGIPYCSKVCCMIATKQAIITKEHDRDAELFILYKDLKTYGKDFYDFYLRAQEQGVRYIKGKLAEVYQDPKTKNILATYEDLESGNIETMELDLLVLSVPVVPSSKNKRLSKALKLAFDENTGFFVEPDPLGRPLESSVPRIYICGGALGPIDIAESVVSAIAACMKAVSTDLQLTNESEGSKQPQGQQNQQEQDNTKDQQKNDVKLDGAI